MILALDTNRYTDFQRGESRVVEVLESTETIVVPFVVIAELRSGFEFGSRARQNEAVLQQFLAEPGITTLFADAATTLVYAALYRHLKKQGTLIPSNDLWIASLCVQHNLPLFTRDSHFRRLPQLKVV
jgi:predicted nucleic acid-binding protein